jgi:inner membrane protein
MSPITHFIGSWLVAVAATKDPRDRRLITLAGVLPDVDGFGLLADVALAALSGKETHFEYYHKFHHLLLHGWPGALFIAGMLMLFAKQRWRVAGLSLITFHLHLLCDLLGSRGPSISDLWPICYGEPLFRHPIWIWKSQWKLDGWQNQFIFLGVFGTAIAIALKRGYSFVEVFSERWDGVVVAVLRKWQKQLRPGAE